MAMVGLGEGDTEDVGGIFGISNGSMRVEKRSKGCLRCKTIEERISAIDDAEKF